MNFEIYFEHKLSFLKVIEEACAVLGSGRMSGLRVREYCKPIDDFPN